MTKIQPYVVTDEKLNLLLLSLTTYVSESIYIDLMEEDPKYNKFKIKHNLRRSAELMSEAVDMLFTNLSTDECDNLNTHVDPLKELIGSYLKSSEGKKLELVQIAKDLYEKECAEVGLD